jgi:hypothetical protein
MEDNPLNISPATQDLLLGLAWCDELETDLDAVLVTMEQDSEPETAYRLYLAQRAADLDYQIKTFNRQTLPALNRAVLDERL